MKKLLLGAILGVGAACAYRTMKENGQLDKLADEVNDVASKAKRKIKDSLDKGMNQAEYLKDRAEYKVEKGFEKGKDALNKKAY